MFSGPAPSGNRFYEKVDLDQVGATGHSQGGGGAIEATKDQRITTMAPLAPFVGNQIGLQPDDTAIFFAGTLDDWIPPDTVKARYEGVTLPAAYAELADANHFIPAGTGGAFRAPLTAWMRWQLMGDTTARDVFIGDSCGLCTDPAWTDYEANEALQALGTPDPGPDPTSTTSTTVGGTTSTTQGSTGGDCFTATNSQHRDASRSEGFVFLTAVGSGDSLGFWFSTTSLRQTAPDTWTLVEGC